MDKLRRSERGFTLIELLVVIAIIAVLATIILPGMGNIRRKAKVLNCSTNLQGLYKGLVMYEAEYKNYPKGVEGKEFWNILRDPTKYPTGENPPLRRQHGLYVCPVKGDRPDAADGTSVCNFRGPAGEVTEAYSETDPIGADVATNHDPKGKKPINVLYWGGKVNEVKDGSQEWLDLDASDDNPGLTE